MAPTLKMAAGLELPQNAVTQTFGFIARKGGGKSYAAMKLAEELHAVGAPFVTIDPVGNWYGLRLAADGKKPGLPIPIFGGDHGDWPLLETQGAAVARLIVTRNISVVLDVSLFRKASRQRFVTAFTEELFELSKRQNPRRPRMVIIEEAQLFAPQRLQRDENLMYHWVEQVVRLGRNYGLGCALISQRPQSINKEVLNQVECLFLGQLNGKLERRAIEDWVVQNKVDKKWVRELTGLSPGTMMVWSPQWLSRFEKVEIAKKNTFDASATPELGDMVHTVAPIAMSNLGELGAELAALSAPPAKKGVSTKVETTKSVVTAIAPAAGTLPAALQKRDTEIERLRQENELLKGEVFRMRPLWADARELSARAQKLLALSNQLMGDIRRHADACETLEAKFRPSSSKETKPYKPPYSTRRMTANGVETIYADEEGILPRAPEKRAPREAVEIKGDGELRAGAMRMLVALAQFYPGVMTRKQVAKAVDMKASGGTYASYWSTLNKGGLLEEPTPGLFRASDTGLERLGTQRPEVPPTFAERLIYWNERLRAGERLLLNTIANHAGISKEDLGVAAEMTSSGGTFNSYLSTLRTNKLVEFRGGEFFIHPWLRHGEDKGRS